MFRRSIQRRQSHRKYLALTMPVGCGNKRCREKRRRRACISSSVRSIGAHHAKRERFNRGVKRPVARSHATLPGPAKNFRQQAIAGRTRRVSQPNARSKIAIARRRKSARNTGIGGIQNSRRRSRKRKRLLAGLERRDLIVLFIPRLDAVSARAVIESQIPRNLPTVLRVQPHIFIPAVKSLKLALVILARNPQQKIREVRSRLSAKKKKAAIELGDRVGIELVVVKFAAKFDRVRPRYSREIIKPLINVAGLLQLIGIRSDRKAVESNAFHSLGFRRERHDAGRAYADLEALRRETDAHSADRLAQIVAIAHVTEMKFIHHVGRQRFRVAQID